MKRTIQLLCAASLVGVTSLSLADEAKKTVIWDDMLNVENQILHISEQRINSEWQIYSSYKKQIKRKMHMEVPVAKVHFPTGMQNDVRVYDIEFRAIANGEKVSPKQYYKVNGVDVTHIARKQENGDMDLGSFMNTSKVTDFLNKNGIAYQCGAVHPEYGSQCFMQGEVTLYYEWEQTWQPGINRLEITYKPLVASEEREHFVLNIDAALFGASEQSLKHDKEYSREAIPMNFYRYQYCIDDDFANTLHQRVQQGRYNDYSSASTLRYNWESVNAHWPGIIKNFHLIVDVQEPNELISWCPSLGSHENRYRRTQMTRFEWKAQNIHPQGELNFLVVQSPSPYQEKFTSNGVPRGEKKLLPYPQ